MSATKSSGRQYHRFLQDHSFFRKDSTEGFGIQKVSCPSIRMEAKEVKEPKSAGRERKDRA